MGFNSGFKGLKYFALLAAYFTAHKVKVTLVQALRPCTGRTARRGNRGIALLFF